MPLNDLAKGFYAESLKNGKAEPYEPTAMYRFGVCQGVVGQALFCKDINYDEHAALSGEINGAIKEWHKNHGSDLKPRA